MILSKLDNQINSFIFSELDSMGPSIIMSNKFNFGRNAKFISGNKMQFLRPNIAKKTLNKFLDTNINKNVEIDCELFIEKFTFFFFEYKKKMMTEKFRNEDENENKNKNGVASWEFDVENEEDFLERVKSLKVPNVNDILKSFERPKPIFKSPTPIKKVQKHLKHRKTPLNSKIKYKEFRRFEFFTKWILKMFSTGKRSVENETEFELKNIDSYRRTKFIHNYKHKLDGEKGRLFTLLNYAVILNLNFLTSELLKQGYNVNSRDRIGCTPLHWAYFYKNVEAVDLLIKSGADEKLVNVGGVFPKDFIFKSKEKVKTSESKKKKRKKTSGNKRKREDDQQKSQKRRKMITPQKRKKMRRIK